jgi:hypothetical protein
MGVLGVCAAHWASYLLHRSYLQQPHGTNLQLLGSVYLGLRNQQLVVDTPVWCADNTLSLS